MNKEQLKALIGELLQEMPRDTPPAADTSPAEGKPENADITAMDLRKTYLVEHPENGEAFCRLKARTPARLGLGRAGPRYKTLTLLRFRADHAAAQDAVFSEIREGFAEENGMVAVQTMCENKEQYLTRPDLGRRFDEENQAILRKELPHAPMVQLVVGDGLSCAAIMENAVDCAAAIGDGLKAQGISLGKTVFVRFCRVGAGDAIGDVTDCELVCVLVGERPGLATDKSMSAYITYRPHTGVSESARTVVSNIHVQGTPAVEAGAHIAELIGEILRKKVSGVGFYG